MVLIFFIFLFLAIFLQTNIFPSLLHTNIKPDIFLALTLYLSLFSDSSKGIIYGFLSGMVLDIFTEGAIGPNTLSLMTVGFFVGYIKNVVLLENIPAQALLVIVSTCYQWILLFVYSGVFQLAINSILETTSFLFTQILLNIVSTFSIFFLFNFLKQKQSLKI